jgi:serine/threonine protein kinase/tetratricopeptide (TPR) repeat protein
MTQESLFSDNDPELLMAKVAEDFLRRIEQGENPSVAEYVERYPAIDEVLHQVLPVLTMIGSYRDMWPLAFHGEDTDMPPERILGDFKILREIGRGGMGVVYQAREISLGRCVALKVLPFVGLLDPRQLKRFKMEAQVAAQLHHTHIVPVFSVGCERGVHYYAMQYVEGHSLATIIRQLKSGLSKATYKTDKSQPSSLIRHLTRTGSTQNLDYILAVTRIGIQAAEALQHAHDQSVIHRDIKPSNLLLDVDGHLWITDFGLARCQSGSTATLTLPGDILGTLCYMSPEQAAGKESVLDERTDIYSLGATLYELLTLETILVGNKRQELLRQIESETPRSLRRLNPAVPVDLETIILKTLAKPPQDRYATCRDLAEDLQCFIEHRPIKARRPTWAERFAKWSRRHRSLVTAMSVVLLVAVVALCVSTVLIWLEEQRTEVALMQAQKHYNQARDAIDEITRIVERELANPAAVRQTRRELLLKVQSFYRSLLETNSQNSLVMLETARAYQRIGNIHLRLGQNDQAENCFRSALDTCSRLSRFDPHDPQPQLLLADCTAALAGMLQELGRVTEGLETQEQAVQIEERISDLWPENPDYLARIAEAYRRWGNLLHQSGQYQQGVKVRIRALEYWKTLLEQYPKNCTYHEKVAGSQAELADLMWNCSQRDQALDQAEQAVAHFEHMAVEFPDQLDCQKGHVLARMTLATILGRIERFQEADEQLAMATDFQQRLMSLPENHDWFMAWSLRSMGSYQEYRGRIDEAIALYQRSCQLKAKYIQLQLYSADLRRSLAYDYCGLGHLQCRQGRFEMAEQVLNQGKALCEQLIIEVPDYFENQIILARILIRLGKLRLHQGRFAEAVELVRQARRLQDEILRSRPNAARWSWRFGWNWSNSTLAHQYTLIAEVLTSCGCFQEKEEVLNTAIQLDPESVKSY